MNFIYAFGAWSVTYLLMSTFFVITATGIQKIPYFKSIPDRINLWRIVLFGTPVMAYVVSNLNTGFLEYYACPVSLAAEGVSERMLFASNILGTLNQSSPFYFDYNPILIQGFFVSFFGLWFLIATGIAIRYTWSWVGITKKLKQTNTFRGDDYPDKSKVSHFLEQTGLILYLLDERESPYAFGKKTVGLPKELVESFSDDQLLCILAHEYSHIKNRDDRWLMISRIVNIALFFQPLNYWILQKLKDLTEERSDAEAIVSIGDRKTIAETLLAVAQMVQLDTVNSPKIAFFKKQPKLLTRIDKILRGNIRPGRRFSFVVALLFFFILSLLVPVIKADTRNLQTDQTKRSSSL